MPKVCKQLQREASVNEEGGAVRGGAGYRANRLVNPDCGPLELLVEFVAFGLVQLFHAHC